MKDNTRMRSGFLTILFLFVSLHTLQAQDTVRITLADCEKQFLDKNLQLLVEKYNIDISRAQLIQARLYNNPNLQLSAALYNPVQHKVIDVSNETGEYSIAVQQLILLAGKRNKEIKLAKINSLEAENTFFDLLRTLRFTLRSDFYNLLYLQNSYTAYQKQVTSLEKMNGAYEDLQAKGVVSLKDAMRIKSLLYSLKAEQAGLQTQINEAEADMQLLLQNNKVFFVPVAAVLPQSDSLEKYNLKALLDTAYANRYDLKLAENKVDWNTQNYALQKANAVPDLTLGGQFDKRGSYVDNATFINVGIDLPVFNRNQGNIRAAKISMDQTKAMLDMQKMQVENDVQKAYINYLNTDKMLRSFDPEFRIQFEKLLTGVTENFERKNISLIEFTDFYESYKNNVLQINQLQNQRMQAIEALYFAIGKTLSMN
jgi:outer membrane protein, heavy metal efflux system